MRPSNLAFCNLITSLEKDILYAFGETSCLFQRGRLLKDLWEALRIGKELQLVVLLSRALVQDLQQASRRGRDLRAPAGGARCEVLDLESGV